MRRIDKEMNPEQYKKYQEYQRDYMRKKREDEGYRRQTSEYQKAWWQKNREAQKERRKEYYESNKERILEKQKEYRNRMKQESKQGKPE